MLRGCAIYRQFLRHANVYGYYSHSGVTGNVRQLHHNCIILQQQNVIAQIATATVVLNGCHNLLSQLLRQFICLLLLARSVRNTHSA